MSTSDPTPAPSLGTVRDYVDLADVMLVTLDAAGCVTHINRRGCEILGWDASDVIGRDWFEHFIPAAVRADVRDVFARVMRGELQPVERHENPVLTRSGDERLLAWHNAPVRVGDGQIVASISSGLDITRARRVEVQEARLVKELTDIKFALDQSAIVATTDVGGRITYVNDKFCSISQYAREELLGEDHRLINSGHHPASFFAELWTTIGRGEIWRGEIRNRAKDGSTYWVDTTIVPFLDGQGRPYQYMAIRYEVTQRREAEARLLDQQTLARLGEMSAVVAHEVKNPLAGISGALQVIATRLPEESRDRAVIGDIQARISVLNDMVQDLLLFARPRRPSFSSVPLGALAREVAGAVHQDPALAEIQIGVSGDNPVLPLDREQMRIVLQNLILNAAQASDGRGSVDVEVRGHDAGCTVTVTDDGPGLTPDVARQLFEPFFTTKHRGSGLGLPTARRIVEAHHGEVTATNHATRGAVLTISLPPVRPAHGDDTGHTS